NKFILSHILPFLFTAPPPPHFYSLSLHDALPISSLLLYQKAPPTEAPPKSVFDNIRTALDEAKTKVSRDIYENHGITLDHMRARSEEHTSELQSRGHLVCRLLLEKKNKNALIHNT